MRNRNHTDGANANPNKATAVIATLTAVTFPVLNLFMILLENRLDMIVPRLIVIAIQPAVGTGAPSSALIAGQALPRSESGRPRLIKARYIIISKIFIVSPY